MIKEQSVFTKIMKVFSREGILLQLSIFSCKINLHFPRHRLAIEVDKKGHKDRNKCKKVEREQTIKKHLDLNFLGLILMKNILKCILRLVKYTIILLDHLKNRLKNRQDFKKAIRIKIYFKSFSKIKVFKVRCQNNVAIVIKPCNAIV